MSSLQTARTIIELVDHWMQPTCLQCGQFIDVVWCIPEREMVSYPEWANDKMVLAHCPECLLKLAPDSQRSRLARRFQGIRSVRRDMGLGTRELSPEGRRALGGHWGSPTLFMSQWFPQNAAAKVKDGPEAPYLEEYNLVGIVAVDASIVSKITDLLPYPAFTWITGDSAASHFASGAIYLAGEPALAAVHLAVHVCDPNANGAELRYHSNPLKPRAPYRLTVHRGGEISTKELCLLTATGERLFSIRNPGGRPPQTNLRDEHYYIAQYRALSQQFGRDPRQNEFIEYLRDQDMSLGRTELNRTTLKRNLMQYDLWPMEKLVARAKRSDNRN
jgi:hypothetical protein